MGTPREEENALWEEDILEDAAFLNDSGVT